MKKLLALFILLVLSYSCKNEPKLPPNIYQINITAKGVYNGIRAHIIDYDDRKREVTLKTEMVVNEASMFYGSVNAPSIKYLTVDGINSKLPIVFEPGMLNIEINKDNLENSIISGSKTNQEFKVYRDSLKTISDKLFEVRKQINIANRSGDQNTLNTLRKDFNVLTSSLNTYPYDYIDNHTNSSFSLILLESLLNSSRPDINRMKTSLENLESIVNKNENNKFVAQKIESYIKVKKASEPLAIGKIAPDFSGPSPDGDIIKLSDIKGKVTLIDFWASWCKPCRRENPNVVKVYEKYHSKGLEIISVSLDKNGQKANWLKAIKDDKLQWHHVSNLRYWNEPIAKQYKVRSIPATFLIDEHGKIIAKKLRGQALENKIASLLD